MEGNLTYFALLLFPITGLCLFIWGILYRRRVKEKVRSYISVQGTIVGTVVESDSDSTSYHPVIEYIVYGKTYSIKSTVGFGKKKEEGSTVEVMFNPGKPLTAFILKHCYFVPNVLIALGFSFVFLGAPASYFIYLNL